MERIVYLDNSATTQPTESVIAAMDACMRGGYYNPSSLYAQAMAAEKALNACRQAIETRIHAPKGHVYFTSGGTESNNLAILGTVAAMHGQVTLACSAVEHPSVAEAYAHLATLGHTVRTIRVCRDGALDWASLDAILAERPALVSIMQVNNETGAIHDITEAAAHIRRLSPETILHVDGVQGFLRTPFDARDVGLYTLSAHKIHGPKGVGALWVRDGIRLKPRQMGGGQELTIRSGTENTVGIAGLLAAITQMPEDMQPVLLRKLRLVEGLRERIPGLVINGPEPERGAAHIVNISFPGVRGEVMLHALEGEGVLCSTGSACSSKKRKISPVLTAMGVTPDIAECALRFSLCPHTTDEEIAYAVQCAGAVYEQLKKFRRR